MATTYCLNHGLTGLKDCADLNNNFNTHNFKMKSMKSINQCKYVIQTTYDIIKAHGGEIKAESKEDAGTNFIIILPL